MAHSVVQTSLLWYLVCVKRIELETSRSYCVLSKSERAFSLTVGKDT